MLCYSSQPFCSSAVPSCSAVLQSLPFCCAVLPAFLQCCSAPPLCSAAVAIFSALWQLTAFMLCNRYQQLCIAAVPSLCVVRQLLFFLPGSAILLRVYHCHAPFPAAAQKYCSFRIQSHSLADHWCCNPTTNVAWTAMLLYGLQCCSHCNPC